MSDNEYGEEGTLPQHKSKLRREPTLTSKYSKAACTRVEVFYDNAIKRYALYYKGKPIIWFKSDTSTELDRVRKHFVRLRNGVAPRDKYKEAYDKEEERRRDDERRWKENVDDFAKDQAHMTLHYIFDKGPRHFVINKKEKG